VAPHDPVTVCRRAGASFDTDPDIAARKLVEIANSMRPSKTAASILINWPFLHELRGRPAEYSAGLKLAIERGWLWLHESGTFVRLTEEGAGLFT
jgi:hypothetical protein